MCCLTFVQDLGVWFSVSRNILSCQIVRDCIEYTGRATHKPDLIHDYCVQEDMNKSCAAAEAVNITSFNINVVSKFSFMHRYINFDVRTYPIIYHKCTVIISEKVSLLKMFLYVCEGNFRNENNLLFVIF